MQPEVPSNIPHNTLKKMLFEMKRIRAYEERLTVRYLEEKKRCPTHLSIGQELDATDTIDACQHNIMESIRQLPQGQEANYCIEAAELSKTIEGAFESVRRNGGFYVFTSHPKHGDKISIS